MLSQEAAASIERLWMRLDPNGDSKVDRSDFPRHQLYAHNVQAEKKCEHI